MNFSTFIRLVITFVFSLGVLLRKKTLLINTERRGSEKRFYCLNMCGRSYKNKQHMTRHMTGECGVQPKFRCRYCMKSFTRKQTLKIHLVSVHNRSPDEIPGNPRHRLDWSSDA